VTIEGVGSTRLTSLERVTTGVGWISFPGRPLRNGLAWQAAATCVT